MGEIAGGLNLRIGILTNVVRGVKVFTWKWFQRQTMGSKLGKEGSKDIRDEYEMMGEQ